MLELLSYLRTGGFKTYIVTGGEQDFIRPSPRRQFQISFQSIYR
jgi:phosphoserine phosphatase